MKGFGRALAVTLGLVIIGSVVSLVPQKSAIGAGAAPINIVGPLPLPVTGSVNATILGTPNVSVSSLPPLLLAGGAVNVGNAPSSPLPVGITAPATTTHTGQNASANIVLRHRGGCATATGTCLAQLHPDGTLDSNVFAIPAGDAFVMTDVSWVAFAFPNPGGIFGIAIGPYFSIADVNASGVAHGSEHIVGGIVLTQVSDVEIVGGSTPLPAPGNIGVTVYGYLVPFK